MEKISRDIKKVFESKVFIKILYGIAIAIVLLFVLSIGISIGFRKASFGRAWGENYTRNFGMMPNRQMFGRDNFPNANGAIGKIIKIELPTLIVEDKNNTEKLILIKEDTKIQKMMSVINASDLTVDDYVVVIGSPNNQGQIEAKFIRIMPAGIPVPIK
ncbi:MAG: hypothetical protein WC671_00990 [Candidatus Paceibacterota bacterium]|jgi:hypothetical protein